MPNAAPRRRGMVRTALLALFAAIVAVTALTPRLAYADVAGGLYSGVSWRITDDGELVIGNGGEQSFVGETEWPWRQHAASVTSVRVDGTVHASQSLESFLAGLSSVTSVDLTGLDTSGVKSMNSLFYGCSSLESVDLSGLDTSELTACAHLFYNCSSLRYVDMSGWDLSNCGSPSGIAAGAGSPEGLDWNLSGASMPVSCDSMFAGCSNLASVDLSGASMGSTKTIQSMFASCPKLREVSLEGVDMPEVTNASYAFGGCSSLESVCLDGVHMPKVTTMASMFYNCSSLESVDLSALQTTSALTNAGTLFYNCSSLRTVDISNLDLSNAISNHSALFSETGNIDTLVMSKCKIPFRPIFLNSSSARHIVATNSEFGDGNSLFSGMATLEDVDLSGSTVGQSAQGMFANCTSLKRADLNDVDMSTVETVYNLIYNAGAEGFVIDMSRTRLGDRDSSSPVNLAEAFTNCPNLTRFVGQDMDWTGAQHTSYSLFSTSGSDSPSGLEVDFSGSRFANKADGLFAGYNVTSLNIEGVDFSGVTSIEHLLYYDRITSVDLTGLDTSSVTSCRQMIEHCTDLVHADLSGLDLTGCTASMSDLIYMSGSNSERSVFVGRGMQLPPGLEMEMFYKCSFDEVDLSGSTFHSAPYQMFDTCTTLKVADLSDVVFDIPDESSIRSLAEAFYGLRDLESVSFRNADLSGVTSMRNMFSNCTSLTSLDLSSFDTSNVTDMYSMFYKCSSLTSVGLLDLDTSNVTNMYSMFGYCSSLATLDLSSFDTSHVTDMSSMFSNCTSLTSLDLSGFSGAASPYMDNLIIGCHALEHVDLTWVPDTARGVFGTLAADKPQSLRYIAVSSGFSWANNNTPNEPPAEAPHDGTWLHLSSGETFAASELAEFEPGAGVYVWSGDDATTATVVFDGNGGTTPATPVSTTDPDVAITMPTATRDGFFHTGWNTSPDGSGDSYGVGQEVAGLLVPGRTVALFAQWRQGQRYRVRTFLENLSQDGYDLASTEVLLAEVGEEVTVEPAEVAGFTSPAAQTIVAAEGEEQTVDLYYDRTEFDVSFDGNGADLGEMGLQHFLGGVAQRLSENAFRRFGSVFLGWSDEPGGDVTFSDGQSVANLAPDGGLRELFARWLELPPTPSETSGTYTVTLRGGQTLEMLDLPAGTSYEVVETDLPEGWEQVAADGTSGTVRPNEVASALVTNRYSAEGEATVQVWKSLAGRVPLEGEFSFRLIDRRSGLVLQTASNGAVDGRETVPGPDGETAVENPHRGMAPVTFAPITYAEPGTYSYVVREVAGDDPSVSYDADAVWVTVTVTDAGHGDLSCEVAYADGDDSFENSVLPGSLELAKEASGGSSSSAFTFDVDLVDQNGTPLADATYRVTRALAAVPSGVEPAGETPSSAFDRDIAADVVTFDANGGYFEGGYATNAVATDARMVDVVRYSHTPNMGDDGVATSLVPYASGRTDAVTIEGAESLDIDVWFSTYSTSYAWLAIYPAGVSPTSYNYSQATISGGKLGGGRPSTSPYYQTPTAASAHRSYHVEGGSATFYYGMTSSNATYRRGYGYHATVTGHVRSGGVCAGQYMEPLPSESGRAFAGWYTDPSCAEGTELDWDGYLAAGRGRVTAYARWADAPETSEEEVASAGGRLTVTLLAGETLTIDGLPDGARYVVTEREAPGWSLVSSEGSEGTIAAGEVARASFENEYSAEGSYSLRGTKELVGAPLRAGAFEFELAGPDGEFVARARNDGQGAVAFEGLPIDPSWAGTTRVLTVREVAGDDVGVEYDAHEDTVAVAFSDDGQGRLVAEVAGGDQAFTFTNTYRAEMPETGAGGLAATVALAGALAAATVALELRGMRRDGETGGRS